MSLRVSLRVSLQRSANQGASLGARPKRALGLLKARGFMLMLLAQKNHHLSMDCRFTRRA